MAVHQEYAAMRLDTAVYVLAPRPRPSMPTRRAFLLIGGAFVAGSVAGGACGYTIGDKCSVSVANIASTTSSKSACRHFIARIFRTSTKYVMYLTIRKKVVISPVIPYGLKSST